MNNVVKRHIRVIKNRLKETEDNIEGFNYWLEEKDFEVAELERDNIKNNLNIVKKRLRVLKNFIE